MADCLAAALALAASGIPCFPCAPGEKRPATGHGFYDATTDEDILRRWFADSPDSNMAIPTGRASGVVVLDIDPRNGGDLEWRMLTAQNGEPVTRTVRTPSGGSHYYFTCPPAGLKSRTGVRPGIDFKADGGYVVVPPSRIGESVYSFLSDAPVAPLPEWLALLAESKRSTMKVPTGPAIPRIGEGERNARLFSIARGCRADGYTETQILERLRQLNHNGTVSPPLDDAELVSLARQGARVPIGREGVASGVSGGYNLTDLGNAQRLADRHAGDIYWLTDRQAWLTWDGARFRRDSGELVLRAAQETLGGIYAEAAAAMDADERKKLATYALGCEREGKLRSMVSLARAQSAVMATSEAFDSAPDLLNVSNGTLDLRTAELGGHTRENRITRMISVPYAHAAPCPVWMAFLERIMDGNHALIEYLRRAVGYSLTGHTREHCLFLLHGTGANGKSTFTETLADLFGEYAMHTQFSTWAASERGEATHEIAALAGARLVVSNESESGSRFAESLVKQATGGDRMRGCFKYQNSFEFSPSFKLWLAFNHKPSVRGTDEGFWRRIRLVPFGVTIPPEERDHELRDKLRAELPGILSWAVRGAFEWYQYGLSDPPEVLQATEDYRADQDWLATWLDAFVTVEPDCHESSSAIYKSFKTWCEAQGARVISNKTLSTMLKDRGFQSRKNRKGLMEWVGIRVNDGG